MNGKNQEIEVNLEYYIELPFNLALPTGHYALNIPNQIRIRREMYLLQRGNELENISTTQKILEPQDRLYDEHGLVNKKFVEFTFKRKLKTVLFAKYKQIMKLFIDESKFLRKLEKGEISFKDIQIPKKVSSDFHRRFMNQVNEFLIYYINFFPINNIQHLIQHEVRPLSVYEFSKCETGIIFVFKNIGIALPSIIDDYNNYTGIPEFTFVNKAKIQEFEKFIQNRKSCKIFSYQEMFNLARFLYRTNKENMITAIVINAVTAIESILNILEEKDLEFQNLKIKRKRGEKRKIAILNFYLNQYRKFNNYDRPLKVIRKTQFKICKLIKINNPVIKTYKNSRKIISILNFGRLIRNEIIHQGKIRYNKFNDTIRFKFKPFGVIKKIKFHNLWASILNAYYSFNMHISNLYYPKINWNLESQYSKSHIASSTTESRDNMILMIPNYDWREIHSYNYILPEFTVPPEKFPIGLKTTDNKLINLNVDYQRGRYELVDQIMGDNDEFEAKWITWNVDFSYDKFKTLFENKTFNFIVDRKGQIYNYRCCQNCDFIIPVHRHIIYNNNKCPKCKNEFDLKKFNKEMWIKLFADAFNKEKFEQSIKYIGKAIKIDPNDKIIWNDYGLNLLKLKKYNESIRCLNKAIDLDNNFGDPYYNKACALSLSNNKSSAIKFLKKSIEINKNFKDLAKRDSDFDIIRNSKDFKDIIDK